MYERMVDCELVEGMVSKKNRKCIFLTLKVMSLREICHGHKKQFRNVKSSRYTKRQEIITRTVLGYDNWKRAAFVSLKHKSKNSS